MTLRPGEYYREHSHAILALASKFKKADSSDPFVFNRVVSHILNGVGQPEHYNYEFKLEYRTTENGEKYSVMVPVNMKRGA